MKTRLKWEELVVWEDEDFVLINKPTGISTLDDRNDPANILALARAALGDAQVCHRLDKDTSGVLAIAKNPEAYRHLSMQFEHRTVEKIYHAVVDGVHNLNNQVVDAPILKMDDGTVRISKEGKKAVTSFSSLEAFRYHTLLECKPVTGRMHQIRIHLTLVKAPITGDELYGGKLLYLSSLKRGYSLKKETEEQPLMKRMALHAFSLKFANLKGIQLEISAPYPKDMNALIRQLRLNS